MTIIGTAGAGLLAAQARFAANAEKIARYGSGGSDADLAGAVVGLAQSKIAFGANLAVARTADDMLKQILDLRV